MTALLVALCAFSVSCAGSVGQGMQDAVRRTLSDGGGLTAVVRLDERTPCPRCASRILHQLAEIQGLPAHLELRSWTRVQVTHVDGRRITARPVAAVCVRDHEGPRAVAWVSAAAAAAWTGPAAPTALALAGAQLLPQHARRDASVLVRTDVGSFQVVGSLGPIASGALEGALNGALVVRERDAGSRRLCRSAVPELLVRATQAGDRASALEALEDVARTAVTARPRRDAVLAVRDDARLLRVLERVAASIGRWTWMAPVILTIVCGISAFSVNLIYGHERVHEFGIQRAVGARRDELLLQLWFEAIIVSSAALVPVAWFSLAVAGLQPASAASGLAALRAFALGGGAAFALSALGVVIPGWQALNRSDISALERAG